MLLQSLNEQIKRADEKPARLTEDDEVVARLRTVPGVGVVAATSFVSTLDDAARFAGAKEARLPVAGAVRAQFGRVPAAQLESADRRMTWNSLDGWGLSEYGRKVQRNLLTQTAASRKLFRGIRDTPHRVLISGIM
ncbi:MAG: hypothetical protein ABR603_19145 [Pyrinomonadaceae bacterium]